MTISSVPLLHNYTTKSGKPITLGTGTGTKWQWLKKGRPEEEKDTLVPELVDQVLLALQNGFNHIDTAEVYTTHPEVAEAVKQSGIAREDLWITTKYALGFKNFPARSKNATEFIDRALKELNTDYIDLLLIHSPFYSPENSHGQNLESAWEHIIAAKKAGKVREIGVSNFAVPHIEEVLKATGGDKKYYPKVNQIEYHPYLPNQTKDIVEYARKNDILIEAYGPLTPLFRVEKDGETVDHPLPQLLHELAAKYNKTDSQILLRWTYQNGILPITTSSKKERIEQSLAVTSFELDQDDVDKIAAVGKTFAYRGFFFDGAFEPFA